jgi:methionine sulfoxide reductase heme-binding subunit
MQEMTLWELSRACAFTAFGCYTLTVCWGILLSARSWKPAAAQFVFHRFLSTLGLVAMIVHVVTLMFDHYAHVGLGTLAGVDSRRGVQVGVAALWLAVILPFTFKLRERKLMSVPVWRAIHYLGYAMWVAILVHGIAEGTDSGAGWVLGVYAASAALVASAAWWRWVDKRKVNRSRRASRAGASNVEAA